MTRIAYVNGIYEQHAKAHVHIEDRGYQFADGVYEVVALYKGLIFDEAGHLERLERSMREMRLAPPVSMQVMKLLLREIQRRNLLQTGLLYIQVSRGVATRFHPFPDPPVKTSLIITAKHMKIPNDQMIQKGISIVTLPETRWARCDIKAIALLPNVLAKQEALDKGANDAWFVDQKGFITEASAANAWIINDQGILQTRQVDDGILSGITRKSILSIAKELNIDFLEKPFSVEDALKAKEAFITSATNYVMPVTKINETIIGAGSAGPIALRLRKRYLEAMVENASHCGAH